MLVEPSGFRTDWAGRSAKESARQIDDYVATAGAVRLGVRASSGKQFGDPARAATAIIDAVASGKPPHHLLLGKDAFVGAMSKVDQLRRDFTAAEKVARGADFPTAKPLAMCERTPGEPEMLRIVEKLEGLAIDATDGVIGKVKDFYFDDEAWVIRYMVVDTSKWLGGREVLISPYAMGTPNWAGGTIPVTVTMEQVKNSPGIDNAQPVSRQYETAYLGYYEYWRETGCALSMPGLFLTCSMVTVTGMVPPAQFGVPIAYGEMSTSRPPSHLLVSTTM